MTVRRMSASVQDDGTIVVLNHTNIRESLRNDQSVSQAVKSYKEEYGPLDLAPGPAADRLSQNESLVLVQRSKDDSVCIVCAMTRESVAWTDDTSANELSELAFWHPDDWADVSDGINVRLATSPSLNAVTVIPHIVGLRSGPNQAHHRMLMKAMLQALGFPPKVYPRQ